MPQRGGGYSLWRNRPPHQSHRARRTIMSPREVARLLLDAGAAVDATARGGATPLHFAAQVRSINRADERGATK